ncbi:MAG: hypothetical protein LBC75_08945 [Fibromonadaceae bacterium]|nr:hypothetical protein [Fibromonadaceae bacterium]
MNDVLTKKEMYESALEKGMKEIFEKEIERVCLRLIEFSEISRREGILALENHIDQEKVSEKALLETGIQMAVDGIEKEVIENYLNSWIEANCNNSVAYYDKILASVIKAGVLSIQAMESPRIAKYKITALIPRELIPDSLLLALRENLEKKWDKTLTDEQIELLTASLLKNDNDTPPKKPREEIKTLEQALNAMEQDMSAFQYVPDKFKTTEFWLKAFKHWTWTFLQEHIPEESRTAELWLEAVKKDCVALAFMPDELKTLDMCIEKVKQETWAFMVVPENLKEQVTTATGVQQGGTDMLHYEYESALEKGVKELFQKEVEQICHKIIAYSEIARGEGILALENCIDQENISERDFLETGIMMAVNGTERNVVETYLNSWIEANCNNSVPYYEKIIASIIKTGVLSIQAGENPRITEYRVTVLIPRELTPDSLMPSNEKYFRRGR